MTMTTTSQQWCVLLVNASHNVECRASALFIYLQMACMQPTPFEKRKNYHKRTLSRRSVINKNVFKDFKSACP